MSWFRRYKDIGDGNPLNVAQNIYLDNENSYIPQNLPTFIIGSKNAGKSTFISTIIKAEHNNEIYKRIFYIYSDHVDTTLAETCHESLVRIPLKHCIRFISEYFKIKAEYMSWIKFIYKNGLYFKETVPDVLEMTKIYTDNIIDEYIRNNININTPNSSHPVFNKDNPKKETQPSNHKLKEYACKFIEKYSEKFELNIDSVIYHIDGLRYDQYDQLIIDDIGVAADYLFPTNVNKSPLYKFLTISRHILLGTIIAGQDTLQLPKYARKEINTYLFGVGINIDDVDKTNIPKQKQRDIIKEYNNIKQYDFIIYNGIDNVIINLNN